MCVTLQSGLFSSLLFSSLLFSSLLFSSLSFPFSFSGVLTQTFAQLTSVSPVGLTWPAGARCPVWAKCSALWTLFAEQEGHHVVVENLEVIKVNPEECTLERFMEQTVQLAESVGEARPPGIAKHSASTKSQIAVPSGEAGSASPKDEDTTSAVAKSAGEGRPFGIAKHSAMTESGVAVLTDENVFSEPERVARPGPTLQQSRSLLINTAGEPASIQLSIVRSEENFDALVSHILHHGPTGRIDGAGDRQCCDGPSSRSPRGNS